MPDPFAAVVPTAEPSMYTVTVLFASAVPLIGGLLLFVNDAFAGTLTTGAAGATVSTVKLFVLENTLVLLAASVAVAFTACDPSLSATVGV